MAILLLIANPRLLGVGVSNTVSSVHSLTSSTVVVEYNASTRDMHTTVQDGVTVVISKVVTEVGGTQTTVSRPIVQEVEHALTIPLA
jgi:hypothetical protein